MSTRRQNPWQIYGKTNIILFKESVNACITGTFPVTRVVPNALVHCGCWVGKQYAMHSSGCWLE